MYNVEKITEPLTLGEAPHWDDQLQVLYFVDIIGCTINKYDPATKIHTQTKLDAPPVGFIIPVEGTTDQFVAGLDKKFVILQWDGQDGSQVKVKELTGEVSSATRINDGKCDPMGRLFAGSLGGEDAAGNILIPSGCFYRLDGTKTVTLADKILISNGLAWDLKKNAFYYIDSLEYNIRRYDYDVGSGHISNMTHIFDFKKNNITDFPDGMTIDTNGNLWVACFNGKCVIQIDPNTGELLQKIPIPANQVTSLTFGGPDLDILFVTTASITWKGAEQKPPCGATFMVTGLGVKGHPNVNFKM